MAAYAALCSLKHIVEQIQRSPRPPISLDEQQVQSLTENVTFLQEFLEGYSNAAAHSKAADPLESRIADAAHAAEDVIESYIVDRIHAGSTSHGVDISPVDFHHGLQKAIKEMDSIEKEVMEIGVQDQHHRKSISSAGSSRPSSTGQNTMVGFDDAMLEILDKLTGGDHGRQVIPIVGMGGMGKTTLARNVYENPLIQQYFDVCAWATISLEYNTREILREILSPGKKEELGDTEELGERLHKYLSGRRYLIVLDDIWSIEAWYEVRRFLPDYNNGSRIVITTRLSNLTSQLAGSYCLEMKFLDEDTSWNLLCKTVFGEEGCPPEQEEIGKKIVENCGGLPLSIVVTGGLLVKSKHSREYWESIAENLNSLVNSQDNDRCLNILYLSYKEMPVYLKPCFLYMGAFSKDIVIGATMLIRLWVDEGFVKPASGKSLEEVAQEFLEELIDRNLVRASSFWGRIKECSMHDLLRDLCLREAQKERFYYITKEHKNDSKGMNSPRRIFIPEGEFKKEAVDELQSMLLARSLIFEDVVVPLSLDFRLLRILNAFARYRYPPEPLFLLENLFHFVNSRYLAIHVHQHSNFPSSVCLLWNLHTLKVNCTSYLTAPTEIWMMPQLRHVEFVQGLHLPEPPRRDDGIVLTNLQSLSMLVDFKCSEDSIQRIPNLKKLRICCVKSEGSKHYCLNNLDRLHKLESFNCAFYSWKPNTADILHKLSFPLSLKRLSLEVGEFCWDETMEKISSLPLLEVLKLEGGSVGLWETDEGQFRSLKFLSMSNLRLEYWNSESSHFPCLEQLVLRNLDELKEIPSGIGDIPTIQSILLSYCSYSVAISARKMLEEQEEFGDVTLQVQVHHMYTVDEEEALKRLESPNFKVRETGDGDVVLL